MTKLGQKKEGISIPSLITKLDVPPCFYINYDTNIAYILFNVYYILLLFYMTGEKLKNIRLSKEMTLDTLSELSGIARSHLIKLEQGSNWTRSTMEKVLKPLGYTIDFIPESEEK